MNTVDNSLIDQSDWIWIFSWEEVFCYLTKHELSTLSVVCRRLRLRLKPFLFELLNIWYYQPDYDDNSSSDSHLSSWSIINSQIDKFQRIFAPLKTYPRRLAIGYEFNHVLILSVTGYFQNLRCLNLEMVVFPLETLSRTLQQLNSLEILTLRSIFIIVWTDDERSNIRVKFPNSLKVVEFHECLHVPSRYIEDPLKVYRENCDFCDENYRYYRFHGHYLPNLQTLICPYPYNDLISMMNEFLSNNRHIQKFSIHLNLLFQKTLNLLKKCTRLTHLTFSDASYFPHDLSLLNIPLLNSIKEIGACVKEDNSFWILIKFSKSCPNVTHLELNYLSDFRKDFNSIISNLPDLQTLTIDMKINLRKFLQIQLPRNRIKHITLKCCDPLLIDFNKFNKCVELKRVSIILDRYAEENIDSIKSKLDRLNEWEYLVFDKSIQCYKV